MIDTVTLPKHVAAWLTANAINTLTAEVDAEHQPRCSNCCAACGALVELAASGQLDKILDEFGPSFEWWDDEVNGVDRGYLSARIRAEHYHNGESCLEQEHAELLEDEW